MNSAVIVKEQPKEFVRQELPTKARPVAFIVALSIWFAINLALLPNLNIDRPQLTSASISQSGFERVQKAPWAWWIARSFFRSQPADIVLLGDSQMNSAMFQADAFLTGKVRDCVIDHRPVAFTAALKRNGVKLSALNLATPGSFASDQFVLAKALFEHAPPKVVVLGVSPRFFLDGTLPSVSSTETFKFFAPYVDLTTVSKYTFTSPLEQLDWWLKQHVPLIRLHDAAHSVGSQFFSSFGAKQEFNSKQEQNLKNTADKDTDAKDVLRAISNSTGDFEPGENVVPPIFMNYFVDNTKEYARRYKDMSMQQFESQQAFLVAYINYLHSIHSEVVIVGMPLYETNRAMLSPAFWSSFRKRIGETCHNNGAYWYDLSGEKCFTKPMFLDAVHLNFNGGTCFCNVLAAYIANLPFMSKHNPKQ
jgi:hypothetical protein